MRVMVPGGSKVVIRPFWTSLGVQSGHFGQFWTSFWSILDLILDKFHTNLSFNNKIQKCFREQAQKLTTLSRGIAGDTLFAHLNLWPPNRSSSLPHTEPDRIMTTTANTSACDAIRAGANLHVVNLGANLPVVVLFFEIDRCRKSTTWPPSS